MAQNPFKGCKDKHWAHLQEVRVYMDGRGERSFGVSSCDGPGTIQCMHMLINSHKLLVGDELSPCLPEFVECNTSLGVDLEE